MSISDDFSNGLLRDRARLGNLPTRIRGCPRRIERLQNQRTAGQKTGQKKNQQPNFHRFPTNSSIVMPHPAGAPARKIRSRQLTRAITMP